MSSTKAIIVSALIAFVEARFGQEQTPVAAIQALSNRGNPGQAATLAGSVPGVLLAAADACAKLELADNIVTQLGSTQDVIDAAKALVGAEMNFNPFAVKVNKICDDASLPATEELRGIVPLVDPSTDTDGTQNANAKASLTSPFEANGLSVAAITQAQGFTNFAVGETGQLASGGAAAGGNNNNNNGGNNNNNNNGGNNNNNNGGNNNNNNSTGNAGNNNNNAGGNNNNNNNNNGGNNNNNNNNGGNNNAGNGNAGAADFGKCTPTMDFKGGRGNRPATEFTFLPTDPVVAQGQQEALNPNIITNRICDQLTNVCAANAAAKTLCLSAKAQIQALGTKDQSTADAWNAALGF